MIEGKNIILRVATNEDIDTLFQLTSNVKEKGEFWTVDIPAFTRYRNRFQESGWWTEEDGVMLITDKEGKILGTIGFFKGTHYLTGYEVSYRLFKKEDYGKGYTTEALQLFAPYLFAWRPIPRLQLTCAKGNIGSRKVAEKCGFTYIGTLPQAIYSRGKNHDIEIFSLLREDCPTFDDVMASL